MKFAFELREKLAGALDRVAKAAGRLWSGIVGSAIKRLSKSPPGRGDVIPPLPSFNFGGYLVDIADRDALYRAMEEDEPGWPGPLYPRERA